MRGLLPISVGLLALVVAMPGLAHHSFAAVFDVNRRVDISGTVTEIAWTNPHAWIYIEVADADGNAQNWSVELLGINTLLKQGWTPDVLKPGDAIGVVGFGARDGSTSANASSVTLLDTGQELWVSVSRDE